MDNINKCEFYPTEEDLEKYGPFCYQSSNISEVSVCTEEDSKNCQWANEGRCRANT